jgi:hypothetical protein
VPHGRKRTQVSAAVRAAVFAAALGCALGGCGKKGPPLTPIVRTPVAVGSVSARRVGNDAFVTLAVPSENLDGSKPGSVARVEVYGATALIPPPRARFMEIATLVATVPVAPAADPEDPGAPVPVVPAGSAAVQGTMVTIRDALSAEDLTPRELPVLDRRPPVAPIVPAPPASEPVLRRFYLAVAFSAAGRPGPSSAIAELPLTLTVPRPDALRGTMSGAAVNLAWEPSGGILGFLMDRSVPPEPAPFADLAGPAPAVGAGAVRSVPTGPATYNVYRYIAADPLAPPAAAAVAAAWNVEPAAPINPAPLAALTFTDPIALDERQRCYEIRAVRGAGAQRIESEPSDAVCVTPHDIAPPAPPAELRSIAAEGEISLSWEPNVEDDLGGYIVLRGEAGSATLQTLTASPTRETRYTDPTVKPGVRYTYYVRAVDMRIPLPNVSEAAEVSETAR